MLIGVGLLIGMLRRTFGEKTFIPPSRPHRARIIAPQTSDVLQLADANR
jgi:hypothetical protein